MPTGHMPQSPATALMPTAIWARKIATLTPMSVYVTAGLEMIAPPAGVVACRVRAAAPATHSGHWNPTGAATMHSGQIGRLHRVQRIPVSRSGCR